MTVILLSLLGYIYIGCLILCLLLATKIRCQSIFQTYSRNEPHTRSFENERDAIFFSYVTISHFEFLNSTVIFVDARAHSLLLFFKFVNEFEIREICLKNGVRLKSGKCFIFFVIYGVSRI